MTGTHRDTICSAGGDRGGAAGAKVKDLLQMLASIASILTATIAAGASLYFWIDRKRKRQKLEDYLRAEHTKSPKEYRSVTRIMADLGLTEDEILRVSFSSHDVVRGVRVDAATGFAAEVLLRYRGPN
jgi:hypothetical protein